MLAVLKSKKLKSRLRGRGIEVPQRRAERYLNSMDAIWSLQSYLLSEADRCDIPIVTTEDREKALLQIIQQVNAELARHFTGSAAEVFGLAVDEMGQGSETAPWQQTVALLRG
jgi:2-phosphoglycerate kinase